MGVKIIALIGILLQCTFITVEHLKKYKLAALCKGLAAVLFVVIGFICGALSVDKNFAYLVEAGLVFGALGDILLSLRLVLKKNGQVSFLLGVIAFFIGHVLYIIALASVATDLLLFILYGLILATIIIGVIWIVLKDIRTILKVFGVIYIITVSIMTSIAVGNDVTLYYSNRNVGFAIGAVLFLISDVILILNSFGKKERFPFRIANLIIYYLGQLFIALCLLYA